MVVYRKYYLYIVLLRQSSTLLDKYVLAIGAISEITDLSLLIRAIENDNFTPITVDIFLIPVVFILANSIDDLAVNDP